MGLSTFLGVETALRGLLAEQRQLDVAAHNISNANTPGYTRQTAMLVPTDALMTTDGPIGTGVDVATYTRVRNQFLDIQLHAQTTLQGRYDALQDVLQQVELAVNEPTDTGVSSLLSKFWSSWEDVVNSPDDLATRQALVQSGSALASGIKSLAAQLGQIDAQTVQNMALTAKDVNQTVADVAALNAQIAAAVTAGQQPSSDLLDRRDVLIDKLGTLVNISVTPEMAGNKETGRVGLAIVDAAGSSFSLLQGATQTLLPDGSDTSRPLPLQLPAQLTSGKLGGLVAASAAVEGYAQSLDDFAGTLAGAVNGTIGVPFFSPTTAAGFSVAAALVADPRLVPVSSTGSGDADLARAVAALRDGVNAPGTAYTSLVVEIGSDSQEAQRSAASAKVLADSLLNRRESISGVSLDEEMTNLVKYQRAYQAAARTLTAMDDMLDTLIGRTGKVGL